MPPNRLSRKGIVEIFLTRKSDWRTIAFTGVNMTSVKPSYKAPAIERAVGVVELLAASGGEPTLSQLARSLGVGKSSLLGVLRGLEGVGWVKREGKGYRLGHGFLSLARKASAEPDIVALAEPYLASLAQKLRNSVCLGSRSGDAIVIEACAEAEGNLRIALRPGMSIPLLAAATGRAYFSALSEEAAAALLPAVMPRFTARSAQTPEAFLKEAVAARKSGYATDDEEYLRGVRAVAAPLPIEGRDAMVLWVVGLASAFPEKKFHEAGNLLSSTAKKLSILLKIPTGPE